MTNNLNSEILAVRERGGYLFLDNISLIRVDGKDAGSYLHGRSSSDVKALDPGQGQMSSLLDRKGYLIALLSVHRDEDSYFLLSDKAQSAAIMRELSTYHFREDLKYEESAEGFFALTVQGPLAESFIFNLLIGLSDSGKLISTLTSEHSIAQCKIFETECLVIKQSLSGDPGYLILGKIESLEKFKLQFSTQAEAFQLKNMSDEALNVLRIEAGIPLFGKDVSAENLLPETGLEQSAASYNKGCFQGQEVLARIKTYGAPRRALVGLVFDEDPGTPFGLNTAFAIKGEDAGVIKSNCFSPTLKKFIALSFISRDFRIPNRQVEIEVGSKKFAVTVKFLPFYSPGASQDRAKILYDQALKEFAGGSEEKSIAMLREAIELNPLLIDAYESLGVMLSRHEQLDEAIALMHKLMALDPDSIMAHTNLSIYYMQQGDKEKAEEEKAISMSIRMSQLAKEAVAQKQQSEDKKKDAEEAEKRLAMFRQVLDIDPDDLLANNGVGSIYVEIGKYEEAIPYLLKAIQVKPTHTVAYVALGKAFESLGKTTEAIKVYTGGIEVAAKRGDITPMKEMQGLLSALESKSVR